MEKSCDVWCVVCCHSLPETHNPLLTAPPNPAARSWPALHWQLCRLQTHKQRRVVYLLTILITTHLPISKWNQKADPCKRHRCHSSCCFPSSCKKSGITYKGPPQRTTGSSKPCCSFVAPADISSFRYVINQRHSLPFIAQIFQMAPLGPTQNRL